MSEINRDFEALLQSHPQEMNNAVSFLEKQMDVRDCKFGDQIVPTFIKPVFLPQSYFQSLDIVIGHVANILEKTAKLYFTHPELKSAFCLNKKEEEILAIDHGYSKNIVICRPDAFFVKDIMRFVEFNCDSPAGPAYTDITEDIMMESFPLKEISKSYSFNRHNRSDNLLKALLAAYHEFAGKDKNPTIAILDWREVRTQNEFRLLKNHFESKGYKTIIADPRDLKYQNKKLEHNGVPIDLVYRRVIFRELMDKFEESQAFIQAFKDGNVCVVNPFRSRLASSKSILSIITNHKKYKDVYSKEEEQIIHRHIPWTRRVLDKETGYQDSTVFLKKHILSHKEHLVLKPSDSYGGKNVVIGHECPQDEWDTLTKRILENKEDWVVQRHVPISTIDVPVMANDKIELQKKKYNINPFIFGGHYAGSMSRLSNQSVINVSAGGGMVPVIEYKELS